MIFILLLSVRIGSAGVSNDVNTLYGIVFTRESIPEVVFSERKGGYDFILRTCKGRRIVPTRYHIIVLFASG